MKLCIASGNQHKISEMRQILGSYFTDISCASELGIDMDQAKETGATFLQNALIKAQFLYSHTGLYCIADDSGLAVDALNGAPGVFSARYAGVHGDDAANNALLLKNLRGIRKRGAAFVCAVALVGPDGTLLTGTGSVKGRVLNKGDGTNGFGYDPLFFCDELNMPFGKCSESQKNSVSHRFRALSHLLENIKEHFSI